MDTAGGNSGYPQHAVGYAIPINTALSIAGQIAAGRASFVITIGYPPFLGTFVGTGPDRSPLAQAQQGRSQPGQSEPSAPSSPGPSCSISTVGLTPPSPVAPVSSGILVQGVICASPAARAGMTGGAVITAVNGQRVGSPDDLSHVMTRFRPGDTISVTWVNPSGKQTTSRIRLTTGPPE